MTSVQRNVDFQTEKLAKLIQEVTGIKIDKDTSAEESVTIMKDYLEEIIAYMPGHVFWFNEENVFLGCNNLQAEDAGLKSRKEIVGKTNYDMPWKEQAEELNAINDEIRRTGKKYVKEELAILSGERRRIFLSEKIPLRDKNDRVIGVLGMAIDITDSKYQEQELKEARIKGKLLEDRIQTIKAIGAGIAHELRTPLRSIICGADAITDNLPDLLDSYELAKQANLPVKNIFNRHIESLKKMPKRISREASSANTIIDMLLMNIKEVDINQNDLSALSAVEAINHALSRYPFQERQKAWIIWNQENDFKFMGHELLFEHIIFNLMKNALYYVAAANKGDEGKIYISLKRGRDQNRIYFKDTGTGIAEDVLPKIFDDFFSQTMHGTGIGLSFCKIAMNKMGGSIICRSEIGKFTEFILSFPVIQA